MKLSVVLNTLNEGANLKDCLKTVTPWAKDVVVVDMESDDGTVAIAERMGARVFSHERTGYVEAARNFAVAQAKGEWVLVLDADERIPIGLRDKILEIIKDPDSSDVYFIAEKNLVFDKWVKGNVLWPDYHPRLFRKGCIKWSDQMHFIPSPRGTSSYIPATEDLAIHHFSRSYKSISSFIDNYNRYSDHSIKQLEKIKYKFKRRHVLTFFYREFRFRFKDGRGYQDGFHGFIIALLFSFFKSVELLKYWEEQGFNDFSDASKGPLRYIIRMIRDR